MPSTMTSAALAVIAGAVSVAAHGHLDLITAGGESFEGFDPTSAPYGPQPDSVTWSNGATDNGFVLSSALQDADIICHLDATNAALSATVAAGGNVDVHWNQWAESHHGPVIDYLAACNGDCSTVDKTTLKWFKIAEMGQLELGAGAGQTGKWADDLLFEQDLTWSITIPSDIKAGNYVLRHELIALHEGGTEGKTQMYPQCVNLEITGSGTATPEGVVGTELYSSTDPGILYNIYNDETNPTYIIPGPELYVSGGTGGGEETPEPSATSTASTPTATPTSSAVPTVVPTVTPSPSPTSSAVPTPTPTHDSCGAKKRSSRHRRHARHLAGLN